MTSLAPGPAVRPRGLILVGSTAGLVALGCGLVAASGDVPGWEASIFHAVNDLPDWLQGPMWTFQLFGLLVVPLVVAAVAVALRQWWLGLTLVWLVPLKLAVEHAVVKQLVQRERPGRTVCALDESCGHFRDVPLVGLSFVSGHAVIAWSVAAVLWPYLPRRWRWAPVGIASANAVARVYLGAHNPLDVVGGGAVGVAIGTMLSFALGVRSDTPTGGATT